MSRLPRRFPTCLASAVLAGVLVAGACGDAEPVEPPAADPWEAGPPLPLATASPGVVVYRDAIWVAGGFLGPGESADEVWILRSENGPWEPGPALPEGLFQAELVVASDTLFVVGARSRLASGGNPRSWAYHPALGRWEERPRLLDDRAGLAAVAWDGRIWVIGGDTSAADPAHHKGVAYGDSVLVYDPATATWATSGHTTYPRLRHSAVLVGDDRVWVLGGMTSDGRPIPEREVLQLGSPARAERRPEPQTLPGSMVAVAGLEVHVVGGWFTGVASSLHWIWSVPEGTARQAAARAPRRMGMGGAVVWRGALWIVGARLGGVARSAEVHRLPLHPTSPP